MPKEWKAHPDLVELKDEISSQEVREQIEELEKLEKVEAEERMEKGTNQYSPKENFPQQNNGQSRDKSADTCSTCKKKIDRTKEYFALVLSEEQKINGEIKLIMQTNLRYFVIEIV